MDPLTAADDDARQRSRSGAFRPSRRTLAALAVAIGASATIGAFVLYSGTPGHSAGAVAQHTGPLTDGDRFVFVAGDDGARVSVIDSRSDAVVARIDLPAKARRVLVSDAAATLVAVMEQEPRLVLYDLYERTMLPDVALPDIADAAVISPDGYLVALGSSRSGRLLVASLMQRQVVADVAGFADAAQLTFSLDGSQIYVSDSGGAALHVVDIVQGATVASLDLAGRAPPGAGGTAWSMSALTRTPDGRYGLVSLTGSDSVIVVDLSTFEIVKTLRAGRAPGRAYGTADGRLMLVPNQGDATVSVIDTTLLDIVATLPGGAEVRAINTGWFESTAFVMNAAERRATVLDLMAVGSAGEVNLPGTPGAGVVNSTGEKLYVALADVDQVAVIDTRERSLLALIDGVGAGPRGATMARSNNYCH